MSEVYVMVTICSRKNMPRFVDCYKDYILEDSQDEEVNDENNN